MFCQFLIRITRCGNISIQTTEFLMKFTERDY